MFRLGELFGLNIILKKKTMHKKNLKNSGNAMFENSIRLLPLEFACSALQGFDSSLIPPRNSIVDSC